MFVRRALAPALLVVSLTGGCDHRAETPAIYAISVLVEADPGTPLGAASLVRDGNLLATTGADGRATLQLSGAEGDIVAITVRCPPEYNAPAAPLSIPLHKLADGARRPSYQVACAPETR